MPPTGSARQQYCATATSPSLTVFDCCLPTHVCQRFRLLPEVLSSYWAYGANQPQSNCRPTQAWPIPTSPPASPLPKLTAAGMPVALQGSATHPPYTAAIVPCTCYLAPGTTCPSTGLCLPPSLPVTPSCHPSIHPLACQALSAAAQALTPPLAYATSCTSSSSSCRGRQAGSAEVSDCQRAGAGEQLAWWPHKRLDQSTQQPCGLSKGAGPGSGTAVEAAARAVAPAKNTRQVCTHTACTTLWHRA